MLNDKDRDISFLHDKMEQLKMSQGSGADRERALAQEHQQMMNENMSMRNRLQMMENELAKGGSDHELLKQIDMLKRTLEERDLSAAK